MALRHHSLDFDSALSLCIFFIFFNLMSAHDVSIDQMAANRGKRVLIEFVAE